MKKVKTLFIVFLFPMISSFAQNRALFIDSIGNVGINTDTPQATLDVKGSVHVSSGLNGVKIYQFTTNQSPYVLKGMANNITTMTISHYVNCQTSGSGALVFYDVSEKKFKVLAQAGSGVSNRVEVSSTTPNTLNFFNDCGTTVTLTFTQSGSDITATMTTVNQKTTITEGSFNIISQGF